NPNGSSSLNINGPSPTYTQIGPNPTTLVDGTLTVNGGAGQINITSGYLAGSGTVNGVVSVGSDGVLLPGDFGQRPHILHTGDVTLTSGALLQIFANAPNIAGTDYSQLVSSGTVNLGGSTLTVGIGPGYTPHIGDTLTIVTAANPVSGQFSQGAHITVA